MLKILRAFRWLLLPFVVVGLEAAEPVAIIFDTDIQGDVDDVGAVATLHALAARGEIRILAMGVSAKHPSSPLCLDALNHYFGRPGIPIGVNKGAGFQRDSRYAVEIAANWPRRLASADEAPEAATLYRRVLAAHSDRSVAIVSVGQFSNLAALLATEPDRSSPLSGPELVRQKVKVWVAMGGRFPSGAEANIRNHASAAKIALAGWPTPVVLSGWEIGVEVLTGGRLNELPRSSPVRRGYELYNGLQPHKSWDQTAVLHAARCLDAGCFWWKLSDPGVCEVDDNGRNTWRNDPEGKHRYLISRRPPSEVAEVIEDLMRELPRSR